MRGVSFATQRSRSSLFVNDEAVYRPKPGQMWRQPMIGPFGREAPRRGRAHDQNKPESVDLGRFSMTEGTRNMETERKHVMGEGGYCVCPKCQARVPHRKDVPCQDHKCPGCGAKMLRVGSDHHKLFMKKKAQGRKGT